MFLFLYFITIITAAPVVVFERAATPTCGTPLIPHSYPTLNIRYARQTKLIDQNSGSYNEAGRFTSISSEPGVGISFELTNGTIITHQLDQCIDHPAFNFGKFIVVDGPIIASAIRRRSVNNLGDSEVPNHRNCEAQLARDWFTWYMSAFYPIQKQPLNTSEDCPIFGTFYYLFNGNTQIGAVRFSPNTTPSPIGNGCFNDTDPAIGRCVKPTSRRYCVPNANCATTDAPRAALRMGPFVTDEWGAIESIRVATDNTFPFEGEPTSAPTPMPNSSSALVCTKVIYVIFLVYIMSKI